MVSAAATTRGRLTAKRQQEQEIRGYSPSSRWYTALNNAISYVELAETSASPKDRFLNAWSAIYNLYMMIHVRGQIENVTLSDWIKEIQAAPQVRSHCEQIPDSFLEAIDKAKNTLLLDAEKKLWRECKQFVDIWRDKRQRNQTLSAEKACLYTLLIGRDLRNAVSHPTLNPNATAIKRALTEAADLYLPLAIAAIEATIERPPENTTGKATAYRSFLYPFLLNSDSFFSDYYLERLMPEQELAEFDDEELKSALKQLNRSHGQISPALMLHNTVPPTLEQWCQPVLFPALGIEAQTGTRIVTESGIFEPTGVIALPDRAVQAEYQGKAARRDLACLVWVLPWRSPSLDAIPAEQEQLSQEDSPFAGLTYMEIAQRSLLGADVPWGLVTNGRKLRLLSKGTAHKPRAFVEMDLEAVIQQRGTPEGKLAFRYLLGLFAGESFTVLDDKDRTRLDRVLQESERHGQEISDELKQNVFRALEELGDGFLEYMKARPDEVMAFSAAYTLEPTPSDALLTEVYQESMSLMYRLLFLFYAESRDMLPMEDEVYRETYSLEAIRDEIISVVDDPDPTRFFGKGSLALWGQLRELFSLVENGGLNNRIPAYDGGLFDPENHPFLETFAIGDYYLARAIDLLSRTRPSKNRPRGEGRKKVTYRDLDIRHLGSIYEGILEYSAHIATEELAIMQRGAGGKKYEEYVGVSELKADELGQFAQYKAALAEDPENPPLPSRCKIAGVKEPGQYFLVFGGRESKRKSSGSYYTPDYIVQYIVENILGPLVRGENREGELHNKLLTSEEILELKVLDPAMGSGHFLVAATEFLARAYGEALIREGNDDDGVMSEKEFIRYKRKVAERCIYGVDINPMAVELAKLSMWLFTMDHNRPLSFLNHCLKPGNSLIGAWINELGDLPNSRKTSSNRDQTNLFQQRFEERVPAIFNNLLEILTRETENFDDIKAKKIFDQVILQAKRPFENLAIMWIGCFWGNPENNYYSYLSDLSQIPDHEIESFQMEFKPFSWEVSFPEIFYDRRGQRKDFHGFDAVIGNPPYDVLSGREMGRDVTGEINFFKYSKIYEPAIRGKNNLYKLFVALGHHLTKSQGRFSFITPMALIGDDQARDIREKILLAKDCPLLHLDVFPQKDNPENRVFLEAKLSTAIFFLEKENKSTFFTLRTHSGKLVENESEIINIRAEQVRSFDPVNLAIPSCNQRDWDLAINLIGN